MRARLIPRIGATVLVAIVISAGSLTAMVSPAGAVETARSCADTTDPHVPAGTKTGVWTARYTESSSPSGTLLTVTFLGFAADSGSSPASDSSSDWKLTWLGVDATPVGGAPRLPAPSPIMGATAIKATPVLSSLFPRVESPNGRCTIYLNPFSLSSPGKPGAWIGDSIVDRSAGSLSTRQYLASLWNGVGYSLEVDGFSGAHFAERRDALRGLVSFGNGMPSSPKAIVVNLGGNDAIELAASLVNRTPSTSDLQQKLVTTIHDAVIEAKSPGRCLVLTTPPASNQTLIVAYGKLFADSYAYFSTWIGNLLRAEANASATDHVDLLDWAALSGIHHLADTDPGDWYSNGDELHQNAVGTLFLVDSVKQATGNCTA